MVQELYQCHRLDTYSSNCFNGESPFVYVWEEKQVHTECYSWVVDAGFQTRGYLISCRSYRYHLHNFRSVGWMRYLIMHNPCYETLLKNILTFWRLVFLLKRMVCTICRLEFSFLLLQLCCITVLGKSLRRIGCLRNTTARIWLLLIAMTRTTKRWLDFCSRHTLIVRLTHSKIGSLVLCRGLWSEDVHDGFMFCSMLDCLEFHFSV